MAERRRTKEVRIGDVVIGGKHPIAIQSMTNTKTQDVEATVAQILQLERAGCQIIRSTVPDMEAAKALAEIKKQIHIPLVADIHFDYRLAIAAFIENLLQNVINFLFLLMRQNRIFQTDTQYFFLHHV